MRSINLLINISRFFNQSSNGDQVAQAIVPDSKAAKTLALTNSTRPVIWKRDKNQRPIIRKINNNNQREAIIVEHTYIAIIQLQIKQKNLKKKTRILLTELEDTKTDRDCLKSERNRLWIKSESENIVIESNAVTYNAEGL